jgi:hypothetical protein
VKLERIALRTNAWIELHTWLATLARDGAADRVPDFTPAVHAYEDALAKDEEGKELDRATDELLACGDDACARRAVAPTSYAPGFDAALAPFVMQRWGDLEASSSHAIDEVRAAYGPEADALGERVVRELDATWPNEPVAIAVVSESPSPSRALITTALAANGRCFRRERGERQRLHDARIIDCVLVRAALPLRTRSRLYAALAHQMPTTSLDRAWTTIVVHVVASVVTGWEPKHASVYRRSAAAAEPRALAWLVEHWREHADEAFVAQFAHTLDAP